MKIITVDACYIMALERREVLSWLPFGFAGGSFWAAAAEDEAALDEEAAALICLSAPPCSLLRFLASALAFFSLALAAARIRFLFSNCSSESLNNSS